MVNVTRETRLVDFWALLPAGAEETLLELPFDARSGEQTSEVAGLGKVTFWIDECSEGADRGGYVKYVRLDDVRVDGEPVTLEGETDGGEFLFEGRLGLLL